MNRTFLLRPVAVTVASEIAFLNAMQSQALNKVSKTVTRIIGETGRDWNTMASIATISMEHTGNTDRETNLVAHNMGDRTKWNSSSTINVHHCMLSRT